MEILSTLEQGRCLEQPSAPGLQAAMGDIFHKPILLEEKQGADSRFFLKKKTNNTTSICSDSGKHPQTGDASPDFPEDAGYSQTCKEWGRNTSLLQLSDVTR